MPSYYATSMLLDGFATGLIAETREGRPVKIEGNPDHPASLGATSKFHQAAVLQLYDPDRAAGVSDHGQPASWQALDETLGVTARRHARVRVVLEPSSSPLLHSLLAELQQRSPETKVTFHAALPVQPPSSASRALFGSALTPQYDLTRARVLVAFDSDILSTPFDLRYARQFAASRVPALGAAEMSRLYVVEAAPSVTGSVADERLARPSARIPFLTAALASRLLPPGKLGAAGSSLDPTLDAAEQRFLDALARDLRARAPGESLFLVGPRQPHDAHVLGYALNEELGNIGSTLEFTEPAVRDDASDQSLSALADELRAGGVDLLVVIGGNPAYDAPADLEWPHAMRRAKLILYAGLHRNETARHASWFAPLAHVFESWGDGRAYDGTLSWTQPLIRPLRGGKTATEFLAMLARLPAASDYTRLRVRFGNALGETLSVEMSAAERTAALDPEVQARFEQMLGRGLLSGSAFPAIRPRLQPEATGRALRELLTRAEPQGLELNLLPSPTLHDGRFANVSWLLELPDPLIKLTWDNAALMSPTTAARLGLHAVERGDEHLMVALSCAGRTLHAPVVLVPGHADGSVSLWLGYGREGDERLAHGAGVNAYRLRTTELLHYGGPLRITALPERYPLAFTQRHHEMHERPLALSATLAEYQRNPDFTAAHKGPLPSLYDDYALGGPQWAMSIDLSKCIGCSACMVACQAENNVLVVGKEQVRRGRVMHWLRIDTYYGDDGASAIAHQPMLCQHCENAPCEYVCPVNATVHATDGLNEMVYNRCVGTRFCSNNCPYKVRRFNWFNWIDHGEGNRGEVELQRNPEVTVRQRGVMEKCTYCVQRIRAAEITARNERREIRPGEVVTACAQACPTRAIAFGSLSHRYSPLVKWRADKRSYAALHETGARPRTMYLARITNPNPELAE